MTTPGLRDQKRKQTSHALARTAFELTQERGLDEFTIDWGLCMYCGICVEVCPFDALAWHAESIPATAEPDGLRHGIDQLAGPS